MTGRGADFDAAVDVAREVVDRRWGGDKAQAQLQLKGRVEQLRQELAERTGGGREPTRPGGLMHYPARELP